MTHSEINFRVGKKQYRFGIAHNLPKTFGLSIEDAVESWLLRTNEYTAESLCDYIQSKGVSKAMPYTEKQNNNIK